MIREKLIYLYLLWLAIDSGILAGIEKTVGRNTELVKKKQSYS